MKQLENSGEVLAERDQWEGIIRSPDWIVFRKWVDGHVAYLEKKSKEHLRNCEDRKAGEYLFAADDFRKMLESVRVRLEQLNTKVENGKEK